jgi:cytochrome c oxidase cbb3-type subunit III
MTHRRPTLGVSRLIVAPVILFCAAALAAGVASQEPKSADAGKKTGHSDGSATEGKPAFESRCAGCHGLDGRGGERAPDIATSAKTQGRGDDELSRIIVNGVPGTGMPAFGSMEDTDVANVVAYLRALQGRTGPAKLPGDARKGHALFNGKAHCAECHMVAGAGGFIATDLSKYAGTRGAPEIRSAITKPGAAGRLGGKVIVTTRDGQRYAGVARNEDNFSIQVQTLDGQFHLFLKSELESFARQPESLMPADYGATLSAGELNDLISFLMRAAHDAKADAPANEKHGDDEEEE